MLQKRIKLRNTVTGIEFTVFESTLSFYKQHKNIEVVGEMASLEVTDYSKASVSEKKEVILTESEKKEIIEATKEKVVEIKEKKVKKSTKK